MSMEACSSAIRDFFTRGLCKFVWFFLGLVNISSLLSVSNSLCPLEDHSLELKSYTAIGDSFAAGLRAIPGGHLPWCDVSNDSNCTTDSCLKNVGSYPYAASNEWDLENFNFLACAGANTISCKDNQVNGPDFGTPDVVSLHIGGNNNDSFGPVMINCVYKRGWGCDEAFTKAENTINSIGVHLDDLFAAIRAKPRRNRIQSRQVFAMAYPTFYNATAVGWCQSWQINWPSAGKDGMRQRLNTLIDTMNAQLKNATIRAGSGFRYVDTNPYFDGHRLCDETEDVYFQYLLEWVATEVPAQNEIEVQEMLRTLDTFQQGPFHPNSAGHNALLKALTDAIREEQRDEEGETLEAITAASGRMGNLGVSRAKQARLQHHFQ